MTKKQERLYKHKYRKSLFKVFVKRIQVIFWKMLKRVVTYTVFGCVNNT